MLEVRFEHHVAAAHEAVFRFHENPANLAVLLGGFAGFQLLRHEGHVLPGAETWFEQTITRWVPVVLGFRHTIYEPPRRFAEELVHGPFRWFTHAHEFEGDRGGTLVRDILQVELCWQYGGRLATALVVSRVLRSVFAYRHRALDRLAACGALGRSGSGRGA